VIRIIRSLLFSSITKYTSNKTAHCHTRLAKLERNYHINRLMFRTRARVISIILTHLL